MAIWALNERNRARINTHEGFRMYSKVNLSLLLMLISAAQCFDSMLSFSELRYRVFTVTKKHNQTVEGPALG